MKARRSSLTLLALLAGACSDASLTGPPVAGPGAHRSVAYDPGLVSNGSFEAPVTGLHPGWTTFFAGQTIPGGWLVTQNSVDVHRGEHGAPNTNLPDGAQSLDLTGGNQGAVEQILATTAGATYKLSYYMSSNPACDPPVVQMSVSFGGVLVASPTFVTTSNTIGNMIWEYHEHTVVASGSSTALKFTSHTPGGCGPEIDAVSVVAVDTTAPDLACSEGPNPGGKIPKAKNEDGFFTVTATDASGVASLSLGGYALSSGDNIKITERKQPGVTFVNTMGGNVKHFHVGPGEAVVSATDTFGNTATATCERKP
jgi:choice-of-anchor C domain-containing protein